MVSRARGGVGKATMVVAVVALLAASSLAAYYVFAPPAGSNVILMLNFSPSPYHAPFYYGLSQGTYRNNGVNVSLVPAQNDGASIAAVATGQVQFGLTDTSNLVQDVANSNISNVRIVAMIQQKTLYSVIYNEASVHTVTDLDGKEAGAVSPTNGGIITPLFEVMAQASGVNLSSIRFDYSSAPVHNAQLANGQVQFILSVASNLPALQAAAAKNGITLGEFNYGDYGVDTYGLALITSTQMIQQHSDLVKKFVLATMQSLQESMADPQAAAAALSDAQPQLNSTEVLEGLQIDLECCSVNSSGVTNPLQLGWIDPVRMQQTVNTDVTGLGLKATPDPSSLYTNQFVQSPQL